MSVWDQIRCEMPLPEPQPPASTVFMSRDTPMQFFADYTITTDGRLVQHGWEFTPAENDPPLRGRRFGFLGRRRPTPEQDEEVAFNGDLTFSDLSSPSSPTYVACFIDGRCIRILTKEEHERLMEIARRLILTTDPTALDPRRVLSASDTSDDIRRLLKDEFAALDKNSDERN